MPELNSHTVTTIAAVLALATAAVLAWAVSHPCHCNDEPAMSDVE